MAINLSRRGLIGGLVGIIAAPAIVRIDSLMPVRRIPLFLRDTLLWGDKLTWKRVPLPFSPLTEGGPLPPTFAMEVKEYIDKTTLPLVLGPRLLNYQLEGSTLRFRAVSSVPQGASGSLAKDPFPSA